MTSAARKPGTSSAKGLRAGALDRELREEAAKGLKSYGVKVLRTTLTDLAPARVLKIVQSTSKDG
jgi:hypothetical protein